MKANVLLVVSIIAVCFFAFSGCDNGDAERAQLREKLDTEFEKETEGIVLQSKSLMSLIDKLTAKHKELDLKHDQFEFDIKHEKLTEEDQATQKRHLNWEKLHETQLDNARRLMQRFDAIHEKHEEDEKAHAHVDIEKIKEDHEKFEQELLAYKRKFEGMVQKLKEAEKQMEIIFQEHEVMSKKYKP